jgi:hypothetical protein
MVDCFSEDGPSEKVNMESENLASLKINEAEEP